MANICLKLGVEQIICIKAAWAAISASVAESQQEVNFNGLSRSNFVALVSSKLVESFPPIEEDYGIDKSAAECFARELFDCLVAKTLG